MATNIAIMTLGYLTFRRETGQSYNALGSFRLPVPVMLLSLSMMLCMSSVGSPWTKAIWTICMAFSYRVSDLACDSLLCSHAKIQRRDGSNITTWGVVHLEGRIMPWLLTAHASLCLEDIQKARNRMRFPLFTFSTQVRSYVLSIYGQPSKLRS